MSDAPTTQMPAEDGAPLLPGPAIDSGLAEQTIAEVQSISAPAISLSGLDKAAITLVTLGDTRAAKILEFMDPEEAEPLIIKVAQLQNVPPEHVQMVMGEILETAIARGYFYEGGVDYARNLLMQAFGEEKAEQLLQRLQTIIEPTPFRFLARTPPEQIFSFLRKEHPQICAVVLVHLPDAQAAAILEQFDAAQKADVVHRVATMGQITPELLASVESDIRSKMHTLLGSQTTSVGGVESAAELINRVDRQTERDIFAQLEVDDPALAEQLRALLFVFEDIAKLDARAIQQIVQHAEQKDLALALRGANESVRETLFANMSERTSETLREEIEIMPPQRRREVEEAQQRVVAVARRLEEKGDITILSGSEADEVI